MIKVIPVDAQVMGRATGLVIDKPITGYIGIEGEKVIAAGGLAWADGKCWIWLQVWDREDRSPYHVIRWAKRVLRTAVQLGESEVWTPRDDAEPTSERLLTLLGFEKTEETDPLSGKELWIWHHCQ